MTYLKLCAAQVAWYRDHGKYPQRIRVAATGESFVIGDQSWHANYPEMLEEIDRLLPKPFPQSYAKGRCK